MMRFLPIIVAILIGFVAREILLRSGVDALVARLVALGVAVLTLILLWRRRARA